eukprot:5402926-Prymnesium_polylepis.1
MAHADWNCRLALPLLKLFLLLNSVSLLAPSATFRIYFCCAHVMRDRSQLTLAHQPSAHASYVTTDARIALPRRLHV